MKTFTNTMVVFIACTILSYAQGSFWKKQNINYPFASTGYSPKIVSENVAWTYASKETMDGEKDYLNYAVMRTTNGGNSWTSETLPFNGKLGDMTSMAVIDDSTAWVSYVESLDAAFGKYVSKVYKTTNGGKTWTEGNVNIGGDWVNIIHFFDKNTGVIIADPSTVDFNIYRTSNGGTTWSKVPGLLIPNVTSVNEYGQNIYFTIGDLIYFSTFDNRIFYSVDTGITWYVIPSPDNSIEGNFGISRDDKKNLYFLTYTGESSAAYRVGITDTKWTKLSTPDNVNVNGISSVPGTESLVMITSDNKKTYISKDVGNTWSVADSLNTNGRKRYVSFLNAKTGYCTYRESNESSEGILKYIGSPLSGLLTADKIDVDLKLWPNPTTDNFIITLTGKEYDNYWILINDVTGNLLYKKEINNTASFSEMVNIQNYSPGIYTVTISNQKGLKSEKFIKNQ
ncbi:MAG: T9SS type A sorting domain-containing protein [Saprospiraceae bacterium]|jgi:photosystem II stability/assembly factor-like uncharacterized protein|nr:T9SS type A sorting domain-containing protein [Saprospiraceae bacterium]